MEPTLATLPAASPAALGLDPDSSEAALIGWWRVGRSRGLGSGQHTLKRPDPEEGAGWPASEAEGHNEFCVDPEKALAHVWAGMYGLLRRKEH